MLQKSSSHNILSDQLGVITYNLIKDNMATARCMRFLCESVSTPHQTEDSVQGCVQLHASDTLGGHSHAWDTLEYWGIVSTLWKLWDYCEDIGYESPTISHGTWRWPLLLLTVPVGPTPAATSEGSPARIVAPAATGAAVKPSCACQATARGAPACELPEAHLW